MKNLKQFNKLRKECQKITYPDSFEEEVSIYSFEDCEKLIDLLFDDKKLYICINDRQGGEFAVGRLQSAKDWALTALEWCSNDDHMSIITAWLDNAISEKDLIKSIDDIWDITIEEYNEQKHIRKYYVELYNPFSENNYEVQSQWFTSKIEAKKWFNNIDYCRLSARLMTSLFDEEDYPLDIMFDEDLTRTD